MRWFVGVLLLSLTACDIEDFDGGSRVKEDFHYSYALKPGGRVELEGFNGSVEVRGWDKESIDIDGTKSASRKELLDQIKIDIAASADSVRIKADRPMERRGNMSVSFVLSVPRRVVLDRIQSTNGSVRVQDVEGNARLRSSNGSLKVSGFKGNLDATTTNGSVDLSGFTGGAVVRTSNGSIRADGVRGFLEAMTTNGSVDARVAEASGRPIRVESSNGRVVLAVESLKDTDVIANTTNSSVTLKLPSSLNARVRAATSNSGIESEFDVTARGSISKNRLEGNIGSGGGPLVDVRTSNGSIRLQKL